MADKRKGIGDRYQQETKYTRETIGGFDFGLLERAEPFKEYPDAEKIIQLPSSLPKNKSEFWEIVSRRRSERSFKDSSLSYDELALLLFATQGVTAKAGEYLFRTTPSAGALYPIETYLMTNRVESLPKGIYHLNIVKNCLELIREEDLSRELASAALGQSMILQSVVTFIWTAIAGRSKWKYKERAYRYIYLDAGHIGQNLYLATAALELGCCTIGAFFDDEVNKILGIDGFKETAVYMGVVGKTE
jgi:SagB-type dehydrogenase family enzyme